MAATNTGASASSTLHANEMADNYSSSTKGWRACPRRKAKRHNLNNARMCDCAVIPGAIAIKLFFLLSVFSPLWMQKSPVIFVKAGLSIGGVSSVKDCYEALQSAKGDDDRIDRDEYVKMINILSNDSFTSFQKVSGNWGFHPVTDFFTLPKDMQDNFWQLACGGSGDNLNICNEAFLYSAGSMEGEVPSDQQTVYLYQVCTRTETAIEDARPKQTSTPSQAPISTSTYPSTSIITSYPPNTISPSSSASEALTITEPLNLSLKYQIHVGPNVTSGQMQNPGSSMRSDLAVALRTWMTGMLRYEYNAKDRKSRGLRGRNGRIASKKTDMEVERAVAENAPLLRGDAKQRSMRKDNVDTASNDRKRSSQVSIADGSASIIDITDSGEWYRCLRFMKLRSLHHESSPLCLAALLLFIVP